MAPRGTHRVRIVSPNSGSVCYSRSISRSQQHGHDNDSDGEDCYSFQEPPHRSVSATSSSSILKKQSSFGRGDHTRTPLSALPHNQSASRLSSAKSFSRSLSAPVRSATSIEAAYAREGLSASRSHSRRRPRSVQDEEDDERAIERAQEALNMAGTHVLRRPFGQIKQSVPQTNPQKPTHDAHMAPTVAASATGSHAQPRGREISISTSLAVPPAMKPNTQTRSTSRNAAHTSASASTRDKTGRPLQLPRTIPVTRSRSSHASSADLKDLLGDEDRTQYEPLKRRRREERKPDMPAYMAALLPSHRPTSASTSGKVAAAQPKVKPDASVSLNGTAVAPGTGVYSGPCPGMFSGLSSITLSDHLFAGAFHTSDDDTALTTETGSQRRSGAHTSASSPASTLTPSRAAAVPIRRCSRPLWCLVGTFKTGLSGVVSVDPTHDRIHWTQRNPRGGFQSIRVPISCVLDAFVARVTQEDEDIQERQFTVVIRTSTRPSQVVFGFRTVTEANQFLKMVVAHKPPA